MREIYFAGAGLIMPPPRLFRLHYVYAIYAYFMPCHDASATVFATAIRRLPPLLSPLYGLHTIDQH